MFDKFKISKDVYPIFVVGCMSSGKSTFINALLESDIIPSSNMACTGKPVFITLREYDEFDNTQWHSNGVCKCNIIDYNDNFSECIISDKSAKQMISDYNDTDMYNYILLEKRSSWTELLCDVHPKNENGFLVIDTPGVNNSMNDSHYKETKEIISKFNKGRFIYVITPDSFTSKDNKNMLDYINSLIKSNNKFRIDFIMNKFDIVDFEKENPYELLLEFSELLESIGFKEPKITAVSSLASVIFSKVLMREKLTRNDIVTFGNLYNKYNFYNSREYGDFDGKKITIMNKEYLPYYIEKAKDNAFGYNI